MKKAKRARRAGVCLTILAVLASGRQYRLRAQSTGGAQGAPSRAFLQAGDLERMQNGTVRFDLDAIRLNPSLLDQKAVMRYFIGLNNCQDRSVQRALQNELDYPGLAEYYRRNAADILAALPSTAGLVMFRGNTKGALLWGHPTGGWDPKLKTLALGEYDVNRKAFPILVSDKSRSFEVAGPLHMDSDRQSLDKTCPVAWDALMRSRDLQQLLPAGYNVSFNSLTFNELPMREADARKYIESGNSSSQRGVLLTVDFHIESIAPPSSPREVNFNGGIARIMVVSSGPGQIVGPLYDDQSLAAPVIKSDPTALTTMKTPGEFRTEISTVVYLGLASDSCGWLLTPEQKNNLRRYMSDINTHGKFNDKYALNSEIGQVRASINGSRLGFCESAAEHQQFDRRAATLWPAGPMAAPAGH